MELVIVIALLGFVSVTAVPRLLDLDAVRCIHAGQTLTSFLRHGQIHAMQSGVPVSAGFTGKGMKTFFLRDAAGVRVAENPPGVSPADRSGAAHLPWDLSGDVEEVTTDLAGGVLWFEPALGKPEEGAGTPTPLAGVRTVTLRTGRQEVRIFVYPETGLVRMEK